MAKNAYSRCLQSIARQPVADQEVERLARSLALPTEHVHAIFSLLIKEKKAINVSVNYFGRQQHGYSLKRETRPQRTIIGLSDQIAARMNQ